MNALLIMHPLLAGMSIYLSTGVDEFVLCDQCGCSNNLSQICVLHHDDVVVSRLLYMLKLF